MSKRTDGCIYPGLRISNNWLPVNNLLESIIAIANSDANDHFFGLILDWNLGNPLELLHDNTYIQHSVQIVHSKRIADSIIVDEFYCYVQTTVSISCIMIMMIHAEEHLSNHVVYNVQTLNSRPPLTSTLEPNGKLILRANNI